MTRNQLAIRIHQFFNQYSVEVSGLHSLATEHGIMNQRTQELVSIRTLRSLPRYALAIFLSDFCYETLDYRFSVEHIRSTALEIELLASSLVPLLVVDSGDL